jgi:hypothetical protein
MNGVAAAIRRAVISEEKRLLMDGAEEQPGLSKSSVQLMARSRERLFYFAFWGLSRRRFRYTAQSTRE